MNPITETAAAATAVAASLPPLPPQSHRSSTSCDRHPEEHFTGFCPSCLCERLAVLDPNSSTASTSSSSRNKPPTTTSSALKSIFKNSNNNNNNNNSNNSSSSRNRNSFFPELRRTKSFSASKNNEGFSGVFEPQRKSCDVRVRNTLWCLFTQDDERNPAKQKDPHQQNHQPQQQQHQHQHQQEPSFSASTSLVESRNLASSSVQNPVLEDTETESESESESESDSNNGKAVAEEPRISNVVEDRVQEIVEEEEEELETEPEREAEPEPELELDPEAEQEDLKPMKDHIDLDVNTKKNSGRDFKEIAGSFWSAASVFSKKLQKWRQKQKLKKRRNGGGGSATLPVEKPIGRQFRETQSEIADYGYGRRSCDTDPRFSLDANRMSFEAGRMSFDDPRMSFDEPRASWDGYLIGRTFPRMPTMVSVVEDPPLPPPLPPPVHVVRTDTQIPVEEPGGEEEMGFSVVPGGSAQTRDYYSDSSSRRRRSLDRSSSIRKTAAAVVAEIDELKSVSNASANSKVSPATVASTATATTTTTSVMDYLNGPKLVAPERERDSNSNSMRDDCSESFELGFRDGSSVVGKSNNKKSKRWSKAWNIWGFIHRKGGGNKEEDDDRYSSRANGVERSLSESWQESRGAFNRKVFRSNSSVSWRNSSHNFGIGGGVGVGVGGGGSGGGGLGGFGSLRKNGGWEANGNGKKKRDEFVLERNRSARYSPNNIDNGLLRFYLTPMRSSSSSSNRRNGGSVKSRSNHAHSIARSVLRLY